ncbi:hypothetical protein PFISCL1PPCAC_4371, partial [Pristionchus fissidentatus]
NLVVKFSQYIIESLPLIGHAQGRFILNGEDAERAISRANQSLGASVGGIGGNELCGPPCRVMGSVLGGAASAYANSHGSVSAAREAFNDASAENISNLFLTVVGHIAAGEVAAARASADNNGDVHNE